MSNVSPGITIPGIPSAGAFGYTNTQDSLVYDPATHVGGPTFPAGIGAWAQHLQNQIGNLLPAASWSFEDGLLTNWSAQNGSLAIATGPAHSGTKCAQYTGNGTGANCNVLFTNGGSNLGYIMPASYIGYPLCMSAWSYNAGGAPLRNMRMVCSFYTAAGVLITPTYSGPPVTEIYNTWILAPPLTVIVPPTANSIAVYNGCAGGQALGEVRYFDDYTLAPF